MELQTSLGKWINSRLCHPVGLMCCVSVKQLDGGHLYSSDQSYPAARANLKAPMGLTEDSPAQKEKPHRGHRPSFPQGNPHIHLSSKDDRYGDLIVFCSSCCVFIFPSANVRIKMSDFLSGPF